MAGSTEELLNQLYTMIQDAFTLPLGGERCIVERDKVLDLIDEINASLPNDLKQAKTIVEARNEVLTNAKNEAELIRAQAEERARVLISNEEVLLEAKKKSNEILQNSNLKAREIHKATSEYVDDTFRRTEEALTQALNEIKKSRNQFRQVAGNGAANSAATDVKLD